MVEPDQDWAIRELLDRLANIDEIERKWLGSFNEVKELLEDEILPAIRDLQRKVDGDASDPARPGLVTVVHELHQDLSERKIREDIKTQHDNKRQKLLAWVGGIVSGAILMLLGYIAETIRSIS